MKILQMKNNFRYIKKIQFNSYSKKFIILIMLKQKFLASQKKFIPKNAFREIVKMGMAQCCMQMSLSMMEISKMEREMESDTWHFPMEPNI